MPTPSQAIGAFEKIQAARPDDSEVVKVLSRLHFRVKARKPWWLRLLLTAGRCVAHAQDSAERTQRLHSTDVPDWGAGHEKGEGGAGDLSEGAPDGG